MKKTIYRSLFYDVLVWCLLMPGTAAAYLVDEEVYAPVNYSTFLPPGVGDTYLDPTFGTPVKRLSNAMDTPNAADDGNLIAVSNEYATISPFNSDNSRLLIQHRSYFTLYDGQGNYLRDLPFEVNTATEPRWSRDDPNVFYYLRGNQLKRFDIASDSVSMVRTFFEYYRIAGAGETDISEDGNHLVLVGVADNVYEIFVYTLSTDTKSQVLETTAGFDNVLITPDNNVLVGWYGKGTGPYMGVELYDQNMNFLRQITTVTAHMDVGRDINGDEILLWHNSPQPAPPDNCQNAVVKIRLADGTRTCMVPFPWSVGIHISADSQGDSFIVSTYMSNDPAPVPAPAGAWTQYANEILQVKLDGSEVRRLAHHRSRPFNDYIYQPKATSSRDGSLVVFSSNYGLQEILGYPADYSDVYMIEVPTVQTASAGSLKPPAVRTEETDVSLSYSENWFSHSFYRHSGESAGLATGPGETVEFTFDGTGVSWIGYKDEWSGIARVYVDGNFYRDVDMYSAEAKAQSTLLTIRNLEPVSHTLRIEVTGFSNPASDGAWIWVDAFDVVDNAEENDPAASYFGDWHSLTHELASGGSIMTSMQTGATVDFAFSGGAVSWIGYRDNWSGIANVYIDRVFRAQIDTYSPDDNVQSRIYTISGLEEVPHVLTIEVTGNHHPGSEGLWIWVDAFETLP